jgi:energy-coupling factor transporter ATP-binding protein EcfA2
MALRAEVDPVVWETFTDTFRWNQGEHVSLVGPTGGGKTTLALQLLTHRDYVVSFVSKIRDKTLAGLTTKRANPRWVRTKEWPPPAHATRVLLWPEGKSIDAHAAAQARAFHSATESILHRSGGWCIHADDLYYLCRYLNMGRSFEAVWANGRSMGVSLVVAVQRPAYVPLMAYDQATHLFFWRDNDRRNLDRIAGLGGVDPQLVKDTVGRLSLHEVCYVNTRDGQVLRTMPPPK